MAQIRRGRGARRLAATMLALASLVAARAEAAVRIEGSNGWTLSFDGFVNAFGANEMGSAVPGGGGASALRARSSWTGGVYHDLAKSLKVVVEYTHATSEWHGGQSQSVDVATVGGFFFW